MYIPRCGRLTCHGYWSGRVADIQRLFVAFCDAGEQDGDSATMVEPLLFCGGSSGAATGWT